MKSIYFKLQGSRTCWQHEGNRYTPWGEVIWQHEGSIHYGSACRWPVNLSRVWCLFSDLYKHWWITWFQNLRGNDQYYGQPSWCAVVQQSSTEHRPGIQLQQLKNIYKLTSLCEYMYCGLYICMLPGFSFQKCVYNHQETGCNAEMFRHIIWIQHEISMLLCQLQITDNKLGAYTCKHAIAANTE